jgi:hypothetical protein
MTFVFTFSPVWAVLDELASSIGERFASVDSVISGIEKLDLRRM